MFNLKDFHIFNILGFRVTADWSWIAIFVLMSWSLATGYFPTTIVGESTATYWLMGIFSSALLCLSVVLHEVGHSHVAQKNGIRILGIRLFVFGGVAQLEREPQSPAVELKVALAGPAVSAVLAAAFYALSSGPVNVFGTSVMMIAGFLSSANLAMAVFNLVPGFPLDGGRVLRAILWKITGSYERATVRASQAGQLFAVAFIAVGVLSLVTAGVGAGLWLIFIGMFLYGAAKTARMQLGFRRFPESWHFDRGLDSPFRIRGSYAHSFGSPSELFWRGPIGRRPRSIIKIYF